MVQLFLSQVTVDETRTSLSLSLPLCKMGVKYLLRQHPWVLRMKLDPGCGLVMYTCYVHCGLVMYTVLC